MRSTTDTNTFLKRLGDRHIVRWALAYAAGAWAFLEFTDFLVQNFGWASFAPRVALALAGFGLLAVLVISWFHGETGTQRVTRTELALLSLIGAAAMGTSWGIVASWEEQAHAADSPTIAPAPGESQLLLTGLQSQDTRRALAVLPFVNRSPDPNDEYFVDGVTEDIIAHISRIQGVRVISRTSTMAYKNTEKNIRQIGRELGVDYILEGSVQRSDGQVRINAQLIDARTDEHLWAHTYDRELRDILALQAEVARHIAQALSTTLGVTPTVAFQDRPVDTLAYRLVLEGRDAARSNDPARRQQAVSRFLAALDRDSTMDVAYSALAETVMRDLNINFQTGEAPVGANAMHIVERGLQRQPDAPELQLTRLIQYVLSEPDLDRAESIVVRVVENNPNSPDAHRYYALVLALTDRHEEGLAQLRSAQELDPLNPEIGIEIGEMLYAMKRYDESIRQLEDVIARNPEDNAPARVSLALAYQAAGQTARAVSELRRTAAQTNDNPYVLGTLGYVFGVSGQTDSARAVLNRLERAAESQPVPPLALAHVHAGLGNIDRAAELLNTALEDPRGGMMSLRVARALEAVSGDPAIAAVIHRRQQGGRDNGPRPPFPPPPGRGGQGRAGGQQGPG
jgi:adenylate cyclase